MRRKKASTKRSGLWRFLASHQTKVKKFFICYAVLANDTLAFGNAVMGLDALTQRNLCCATEEITAGIHEQNPEIDFQNLTIIFIKELED
jgi:hypothetical protein